VCYSAENVIITRL